MLGDMRIKRQEPDGKRQFIYLLWIRLCVCFQHMNQSILAISIPLLPRFWSRSTYASIAWDVSQKTLRYSGIWNKASNIWTWRSTTCWWRLWSWNVTHRKKAWMSISRCGVELERGEMRRREQTKVVYQIKRVSSLLDWMPMNSSLMPNAL